MEFSRLLSSLLATTDGVVVVVVVADVDATIADAMLRFATYVPQSEMKFNSKFNPKFNPKNYCCIVPFPIIFLVFLPVNYTN